MLGFGKILWLRADRQRRTIAKPIRWVQKEVKHTHQHQSSISSLKNNQRPVPQVSQHQPAHEVPHQYYPWEPWISSWAHCQPRICTCWRRPQRWQQRCGSVVPGLCGDRSSKVVGCRNDWKRRGWATVLRKKWNETLSFTVSKGQDGLFAKIYIFNRQLGCFFGQKLSNSLATALIFNKSCQNQL